MLKLQPCLAKCTNYYYSKIKLELGKLQYLECKWDKKKNFSISTLFNTSPISIYQGYLRILYVCALSM